MSVSTAEVVLCDKCVMFKQLDAMLSPNPLDHHTSWTELCRSAKNGCLLCAAFVRCQAFKEPRALPDNFDEHMNPADTQISWRAHFVPEMLILMQKGLFFAPYDDVVNTWVELFTEPDDPLVVILSGRPIQTDSRSDVSLGLIRKWVQDCRKNHTDCNASPLKVLPTRVVDVGREDPPVDPFVFVSEGALGEWITLSHCWGGHTPLSTTSANIKERRRAIPLDEFPPTFRDAILLTRKLGFRYMWIDSLCILQDSHQDWTQESSQMYQIYAEAFMNIAASSARNPEDGIFASGNRRRDLASPIFSLATYSAKHDISGIVRIRPSMPSYPFTSLDDEPLNKRAWVLQESTLSPRRIDFGSSELHWYCRSSSIREGFPGSNDIEVSYAPTLIGGQVDLFKIPLCTSPFDPTVSVMNLFSSDPLAWWYTIVYRSYNSRKITIHTDILPAIAGIAEQIAKRTSYHYKTGLWLEDIHRGLLWQASWTINRPPATSYPSWSWASAILPWRDRNLSLHSYEDGPRAEIVDVSVVNTADNPFGEVISAALTIKSRFRTFDHWTGKNLPIYNNTEWIEDMKIANRWRDPKKNVDCATAPLGRVICTLDERPQDVDAAHKNMLRLGVICLQIGKFGHRDYPEDPGETVFALVLQPTGREVDEYRRIGIAEIPAEDGMADNWDFKTVKIV
ncbi:HET-domain-containing protein [Mollisia scopiformis]|uniref:HET-domain-containing protein n=1 Tax=Mollisia scopiformis TaxID=149040 RepID=A0A194WV03_MOLSC|nr:HET-domain-containing protein [Mollisia scopiformis]KUJ11494.1 HET-domain-containing protein [Mollisia scopiformis]